MVSSFYNHLIYSVFVEHMLWKKNEGGIKRLLFPPLFRTMIGLPLGILIFCWADVYCKNGCYSFSHIEVLLIIFGVLSFMYMSLIIEWFLHYQDKIGPWAKKWFRFKARPKILEFMFFVFIFLATLMGTRKIVWFTAIYGASLACGVYHYVLRVDDDLPIQKKENKNQENKKEGDYMIMRILGKIGIVCIIYFFISVGFITWFSVDTNYYSISIGILSVGIALIAVDLADSTDRKIRNQMNGLFLQNLNFIEETRTYYNGGRYDEELLSWKTLQGVIVAHGLNQKIRNKSPILNKYQDKLVKYFKTTMKCLFEGLKAKNKTWANLPDNKKSNFAKAYAMVEEFYAEDKTWNDLNKLLNEKMNKIEFKDLTTRKNNAKLQFK